MPIKLDASILDPPLHTDAPTISARSPSPPKRLLILLNPGRVSRHYMEGLVNAAAGLGVEHRTLEMEPLWRRRQTDIAGLTRDMAAMVRSERIGAVLGYVLNGATEMQCVPGPDGQPRSFFDTLGIPHLMLWTDHPQWASEKLALAPRLQSILKSPNNHHFLKSESAAAEIKRLLGWAHCHGLPVGEDPDMIKPQVDVSPDYDVVAILGSPPRLDARLRPFLDSGRPDVDAIMGVVAETVVGRLDALWERDAPPSMVDRLRRLGRAWADLRRADVKTAAVRHVPVLSAAFPDAVDWLMHHPKTYFDAVADLWLFGGWQRTFYLCYLARRFRVAVFGADWRAEGLGGGPWVSYHDQSAAYARGRVAINISQGSEEEGVSHKPFQIAAAGVAMVHIARKGLSDCFQPGVEIGVFDTPSEACDTIASLLSQPDRRRAMAVAARGRLVRDHCWSRRLDRMFDMAHLRRQLPAARPG